MLAYIGHVWKLEVDIEMFSSVTSPSYCFIQDVEMAVLATLAGHIVPGIGQNLL